MKKIFALILTLWSSLTFSQEVKTYTWEEVQAASPDTVFAISFEKSKLTELPAELARFKYLTHLNLSRNRLSKLPDYIASFDSLRVLDLTRNRLSQFPIEICQLSHLNDLLIGGNDIASIPDCIEYAAELQFLDLYDNPIAYLPLSMMRLKHLQKIDFSGIRFNKEFQQQWTTQLPNTELVFDAPCDCMN